MWIASSEVLSCPLAGCSGNPATIATRVQASGIAIDNGEIYMAGERLAGVYGPFVGHCPSSGCTGAPAVLAHTTNPAGIAVDAAYVYWASRDGGIYRVAR